MHVVGGKIIY